MNKNKPELKIRAYHFAINIIKFTSSFPSKRIYWIIEDQLIRSATSIGANIVEGLGAISRKDLICYFQISLKSANETLFWLGILRDATDINKKQEINIFIQETKELSSILGASLLTLKKKI